MAPASVPDVRIEFLVEPFVAGEPGAHVEAAIAAVAALIPVDVGPFATTASGAPDEVAAGVAELLAAAFAAGATRVSVVADAGTSDPGPTTAALGADPDDPTPDATEFLEAVAVLARDLGATVVRAARAGDVPIRWRGAVVGALRPTSLTEALGHLIAQVERELGGRLASLGRTDKQRAVAMLHDRGAFALRRSTDTVAEAMGVSRITIYNYLNALETDRS